MNSDIASLSDPQQRTKHPIQQRRFIICVVHVEPAATEEFPGTYAVPCFVGVNYRENKRGNTQESCEKENPEKKMSG